MAKIILNSPITTDRYGLHFVKGEAHTDNEYLINRLIRKGVKVEIEQEVPEEEPVVNEEKTIEEMTVVELKKLAVERQIEIPNNITKKAEIIEYINGKENKEEVEEKPTEEVKETEMEAAVEENEAKEIE